MDIEKNLNSISKKLSNYDAKLIPVIKNRTVEEVKKVYEYGFREFGENRLEDYYLHSEEFNDAIFHFIAPLQSRKIRSIFENFEFIHTVSRYKEIDLISKLENKRKVFLQVNIDNDKNKSGIDPNLIFEYFENLFTSKVDVEIITKHEYVAESISTAAGLYDFTVNDKKIKARFTFVFLKNKEQWEILSHHSSLLPK